MAEPREPADRRQEEGPRIDASLRDSETRQGFLDYHKWFANLALFLLAADGSLLVYFGDSTVWPGGFLLAGAFLANSLVRSISVVWSLTRLAALVRHDLEVGPVQVQFPEFVGVAAEGEYVRSAWSQRQSFTIGAMFLTISLWINWTTKFSGKSWYATVGGWLGLLFVLALFMGPYIRRVIPKVKHPAKEPPESLPSQP